MAHPEHKPQNLEPVVPLEELRRVLKGVPLLSSQREEITRRLETITRQRESAGIAPEIAPKPEIPPVSSQLDLMRRKNEDLREANQTLRGDLEVIEDERDEIQERLNQILTQGLKEAIGTWPPEELEDIIEALNLRDKMGEALARRFEQLELGGEEKPFFSDLRSDLIQRLEEGIVEGGFDEDLRKEVLGIVAEQLLARMVAKDVPISALMPELIAGLQKQIVEGEAPDEFIETLTWEQWSWEALLETLREFFRVSDIRLSPQEEADLGAAARVVFSRWRPRSVSEEQTHLPLP